MLIMRVQKAANPSFAVAVLPASGSCTHGDPLDADETREWIAVGVERANEQLGTSYGIEHAKVVANDSRRPEVYAELARRIVIAAHDDWQTA
jgi:hypothetical protein